MDVEAKKALLPPGTPTEDTDTDSVDSLDEEVEKAEDLMEEIKVLDDLKQVTKDIEARVKGPPAGVRGTTPPGNRFGQTP
jgi:predicted RND superfamily exporter protein